MRGFVGRRYAIAVAGTIAALSAMLGGTLTATAADEGPGIEVIGGTPPTQDYPAGAFVSLKYDAPNHGRTNWHTCGATLVFQNYIVTNAHCVTDPPATPGSAEFGTLTRRYNLDPKSAAIPAADKHFWVRAGSSNKEMGGLTATAEVVYVAEGWDWTGGNDLAVLKLDHPLDLQTVPLGAGPAPVGSEAFGVGWGAVNPDGTGPLPSEIQELRMRVLNPSSCDWLWARDICLENPNGTDGPCFGDSGGPALIRVGGAWRVYGSTSRFDGEWCGLHPTIYTSLPEWRTEIYNAARGLTTGALPAPKVTLPPGVR